MTLQLSDEGSPAAMPLWWGADAGRGANTARPSAPVASSTLAPPHDRDKKDPHAAEPQVNPFVPGMVKRHAGALDEETEATASSGRHASGSKIPNDPLQRPAVAAMAAAKVRGDHLRGIMMAMAPARRASPRSSQAGGTTVTGPQPARPSGSATGSATSAATLEEQPEGQAEERGIIILNKSKVRVGRARTTTVTIKGLCQWAAVVAMATVCATAAVPVARASQACAPQADLLCATDGCTDEDATECEVCVAGYRLAGGPGTACEHCTDAAAAIRNCAHCGAGDTCDVCEAGYHLSADASACEWCSPACGDGLFESQACDVASSDDRQCTPCHDACTTCTSTSTSTAAGGGGCDACSRGYFDDGSDCISCSAAHAECAVCPDASACLRCNNEFFLQDGITCAACSAACGANEYESQPCLTAANQDRVCGDCATDVHADCEACSSGTVCTYCAAGNHLAAGAAGCLACAPACGAGEYEAVACDGASEDDRVCKACSPGCDTCTGAGTDLAAGCSTCASGYFDSDGGDGASGSCIACSEGCGACTGLGVDLSSTCDACDTAGGWYDSDGGDASSGNCLPCDMACDTCTGPGSDLGVDCGGCAEGYVDDDGGDGATGDCVACSTAVVPLCAACDDTSSCSACTAGYMLTDATTCTECAPACSVGTYESVSCDASSAQDRECEACDVACDVAVGCTGAGPGACLACAEHYLRDLGGACAPNVVMLHRTAAVLTGEALAQEYLFAEQPFGFGAPVAMAPGTLEFLIGRTPTQKAHGTWSVGRVFLDAETMADNGSLCMGVQGRDDGQTCGFEGLPESPDGDDDVLGTAVAVSAAGTVAIAGDAIHTTSTEEHGERWGVGRATIYKRDTVASSWVHHATLANPDGGAAFAMLGVSADLDAGGGHAIVGAVDFGEQLGGFVFIFVEDPETEEWHAAGPDQKIRPAANDFLDMFGIAGIAIDGPVAVIASIGVNDGAGAVHVYVASDAGDLMQPWTEYPAATLTDPDAGPGECFGCSLDLIWPVLLVATPQVGLALLGELHASGPGWVTVFTAADAGDPAAGFEVRETIHSPSKEFGWFGYAVSFFGSSSMALVGAPRGGVETEGRVYVLGAADVSDPGGAWYVLDELVEGSSDAPSAMLRGGVTAGQTYRPTRQAGYSVDGDGRTAIIGAPEDWETGRVIISSLTCSLPHVSAASRCTACDDGYYDSAAGSALVCEPCTVGCGTCTGTGVDLAGACDSCVAGAYDDDGSDASSGVCTPCDAGCAECDGPGVDTTTEPGCQTCTDAYVAIDGICTACDSMHANCGACAVVSATGVAADDVACTSCETGRRLVAAGSPGDPATCEPCDACEDDEYETAPCGPAHDPSAERECAACVGAFGDDCEACSAGAGCTSCAAGNHLAANTTGCLACAPACGAGEYEAVACDGASEDDRVCEACSPGCDTCTGAGTDLAAGCSTCASGYFDSDGGGGASGSCIACSEGCGACTGLGVDLSSTCDACDTAGGWYDSDGGDALSGNCLPCDMACDTCTGPGSDLGADCGGCAEGYVDDNGGDSQCGDCVACSIAVDPLCAACDDTSSCSACTAGYMLTDATTCTECAPACAVGTYESVSCDASSAQDRECEACDVACDVAVGCTGAGPGACLACAENAFFDLPAQACLLCDESCGTCEDEHSCSTCNVAGGFYDADASVGGMSCVACDSACEVCEGPGTLLAAGSCASCAPGFFDGDGLSEVAGAALAGECLPCSPGCAGCTDIGVDIAAECSAGCSAGYYAADSGHCVACRQEGCVECDSTEVCTVCAETDGFVLSADQSQCWPPIRHCTSVSSDTGLCTQCAESFSLARAGAECKADVVERWRALVQVDQLDHGESWPTVGQAVAASERLVVAAYSGLPDDAHYWHAFQLQNDLAPTGAFEHATTGGANLLYARRFLRSGEAVALDTDGTLFVSGRPWYEHGSTRNCTLIHDDALRHDACDGDKREPVYSGFVAVHFPGTVGPVFDPPPWWDPERQDYEYPVCLELEPAAASHAGRFGIRVAVASHAIDLDQGDLGSGASGGASSIAPRRALIAATSLPEQGAEHDGQGGIHLFVIDRSDMCSSTSYRFRNGIDTDRFGSPLPDAPPSWKQGVLLQPDEPRDDDTLFGIALAADVSADGSEWLVVAGDPAYNDGEGALWAFWPADASDLAGAWVSSGAVQPPASDAYATAAFGASVDVSVAFGGAVVGAPGAYMSKSGIDCLPPCDVRTDGHLAPPLSGLGPVGAGAVFVVAADPTSDGAWQTGTRLTADDGADGDGFGFSVSVSNAGLVAVGAPEHDPSPTAADAGAVYVLASIASDATVTVIGTAGSGGTWTQLHKLVADDPVGGDRTGWSVALAKESALATVVVGSVPFGIGHEEFGAELMTARMSFDVALVDGVKVRGQVPGVLFGIGVAVTHGASDAIDGRPGTPSSMLVGTTARHTPASTPGAWVLTADNTEQPSRGQWTHQHHLLGTGDVADVSFGTLVAIDGDVAVVGGFSRCTVFTRDGPRVVDTWTEQLSVLSPSAYDDEGHLKCGADRCPAATGHMWHWGKASEKGNDDVAFFDVLQEVGVAGNTAIAAFRYEGFQVLADRGDGTGWAAGPRVTQDSRDGNRTCGERELFNVALSGLPALVCAHTYDAALDGSGTTVAVVFGGSPALWDGDDAAANADASHNTFSDFVALYSPDDESDALGGWHLTASWALTLDDGESRDPASIPAIAVDMSVGDGVVVVGVEAPKDSAGYPKGGAALVYAATDASGESWDLAATLTHPGPVFKLKNERTGSSRFAPWGPSITVGRAASGGAVVVVGPRGIDTEPATVVAFTHADPSDPLSGWFALAEITRDDISHDPKQEVGKEEPLAFGSAVAMEGPLLVVGATYSGDAELCPGCGAVVLEDLAPLALPVCSGRVHGTEDQARCAKVVPPAPLSSGCTGVGGAASASGDGGARLEALGFQAGWYSAGSRSARAVQLRDHESAGGCPSDLGLNGDTVSSASHFDMPRRAIAVSHVAVVGELDREGGGARRRRRRRRLQGPDADSDAGVGSAVAPAVTVTMPDGGFDAAPEGSTTSFRLSIGGVRIRSAAPAPDADGGIFNVGGTSDIVALALSSCVVTQGVALRGGAVFVVGRGTARVVDTDIVGNSALAGAAFYATTRGYISLKRCTVRDNEGSVGGAAFVEAGGELSIEDNTLFVGNAATSDGGAVNVAAAGVLRVSDSRFEACEAGGSGGAIHISRGAGDVRVRAATVAGCEAGTRGGAIAVDASSATMDGVALTGNGAGICGGGLWVGHDSRAFSTVLVTDVAVSGNGAPTGGGVCCELGTWMSLLRSTVSDNVASSAGGGLSATDCTLDVGQTTVQGNAVELGGGAHPSSMRVGGGGIYFEVFDTDDNDEENRTYTVGTTRFVDTLVIDNTAPSGGGLMAVADSDSAECAADASVCAARDAETALAWIDVDGTTFTGNMAMRGSQIAWVNRPPAGNGAGVGDGHVSSGAVRVALSYAGPAPGAADEGGPPAGGGGGGGGGDADGAASLTNVVPSGRSVGLVVVYLADAFSNPTIASVGSVIRVTSPDPAVDSFVSATASVSQETGAAEFRALSFLAPIGADTQLTFAVEPAAGVQPFTWDVSVAPCPPGQGVDDSSNKLCTICSVGHFSGAHTTGPCEPCPIGSFAPTPGQTRCFACPVSTHGISVGGVSVADGCQGCPTGSTTPQPEAGADVGSTSVKHCTALPDFLLLPPPPTRRGDGAQGDASVDHQVMLCPEGSDCSAPGTTLDTLIIQPGWWRASVESPRLLRCPKPEFCVGTVAGTPAPPNASAEEARSAVCSEGHTGAYCMSCETTWNHVAGTRSTCIPCTLTPVEAMTLYAVLLVAVLSAIAVAVMVLRRVYRRAVREEAAARARGRFAMGTVSNWVLTSVRVGRGLTVVAMAVKVKARILVGFVQIVTQFPLALSDVAWPEPFLNVIGVFDIINLGIFDLLPPGCAFTLNAYIDVVVSTLTPMLLAGLIWVVYACKLRNPTLSQEARVKLANRRTFLCLLVVFLVYPAVSARCFALFNCEDFPETGESRLIVDYSIDCLAPDRGAWVAYAALMTAVYPFGLPAFLLFVLYRNRASINPALRPEYKDEGLSDAELVAIRNTDPKFRAIAFLARPFEPRYWWYEVYSMLCKVALTGVVIFVKPGSPTQVLFAFVVALAVASAASWSQPFYKDDDDRLFMVANTALLLVLVGALVITTGVPERDGWSSKDVGGLLGALPILVVALGAFMVAYDVWSLYAANRGAADGVMRIDSTRSLPLKDAKFRGGGGGGGSGGGGGASSPAANGAAISLKSPARSVASLSNLNIRVSPAEAGAATPAASSQADLLSPTRHDGGADVPYGGGRGAWDAVAEETDDASRGTAASVETLRAQVAQLQAQLAAQAAAQAAAAAGHGRTDKAAAAADGSGDGAGAAVDDNTVTSSLGAALEDRGAVDGPLAKLAHGRVALPPIALRHGGNGAAAAATNDVAEHVAPPASSAAADASDLRSSDETGQAPAESTGTHEDQLQTRGATVTEAAAENGVPGQAGGDDGDASAPRGGE